ncbi:glycoside hydrolase family 13 protein [Halogeometricum luteum]|uniref:Alpha-glucosidase n=1 Tax=Halogeometricum luteum TaxID=2950537 RepID=A0ABU2FZ75_9EURY|nr:alpha-glucosidase [Halogeometricum sp. S3BR5-2]MDS0293304.1 alpha-glucosidase [Halogeometricum sp. S3BR5-2]
MDDASGDDGAVERLPNGERRRWWKEAVVYQIYPRSFNDSDGDGVGDIPGITERVDHLDDLGVDVVWLNPVYESPQADNGYDIADYRAIDSEYGTMADWEDLRDALHDRDIRLIMDLVVNHTSDEHEWFRNALESKDAEYRDYYFWREGRDAAEADREYELGPADEAPPNDWESFFGGPAWEYHEGTGEWYLHLFDRKQPDLNWENPAVRDDVFEMMNWWIEKDIDGFRMDVINLISKPEGLPNDELPINGPRIHEYLGEMRDRVLDRGLLTVGEMIGDPLPLDHARRYVSPDEDGDGLSMLFHFEHVLLDQGDRIWETSDWDLTDLKAVFDRWQDGLEGEGWNSLYLNNHDQPRMVSRFGDDGEYRKESAKLLGTLLHTLRGTPYVYQGEELGMTNYPFDSLEDFRDVETLNPVQSALDAGEVASFDAVRDGLRANSRDNARTPMQWSDDEHAGFSEAEPWIAVNPNYDEVNAEAERADDASVYEYYRRLVEFRGENDVVVYGDYEPFVQDHERVWAYERTLGEERLFVALNFASGETTVEVPVDADEATLALSNYDGGGRAVSELLAGEFRLRPWEARVYRCE